MKKIVFLIMLFMGIMVFNFRVMASFGIIFQWNECAGVAENGNKYKVYYREGESMGGDISKANYIIEMTGSDDECSDPDTVQKAIANLEDDKRYFFIVSVLNDQGEEYGWSAEIEVFGDLLDEMAPKKPTTFQIKE